MGQSQVIEGTGKDLIKHLVEHPSERYRLIKLSGESGFESFEQAFERAVNRSEEEITAARERVFAASPPPRDLPKGKTLAEVVMGQWPGDETDEQIHDALEKLS